jgi:hypothetical protein
VPSLADAEHERPTLPAQDAAPARRPRAPRPAAGAPLLRADPRAAAAVAALLQREAVPEVRSAALEALR